MQVVLTDDADPSYREPIGPPVRRESAELARRLYEEAIAELADKLTFVIEGEVARA